MIKSKGVKLTQFFDGNGKTPPFGHVHFIKDGSTNDLIEIYKDSDKRVSKINPVLLDKNGCCDNIFFDGSARVTLKDSSGITLWDRLAYEEDNDSELLKALGRAIEIIYGEFSCVEPEMLAAYIDAGGKL